MLKSTHRNSLRKRKKANAAKSKFQNPIFLKKQGFISPVFLSVFICVNLCPNLICDNLRNLRIIFVICGSNFRLELVVYEFNLR